MPQPPLTRDKIAAHLVMFLVGRAAERIVIGEVSAGAGDGPESDLACATQLALRLDLRAGIGASTLLWRGGPEAVLDADLELRGQDGGSSGRGPRPCAGGSCGKLTPVIDFADALLNVRIREAETEHAALRRSGIMQGCPNSLPGTHPQPI